MRELDLYEIDEVAGGRTDRFFESIGSWIDNPFTSAGRFADFIVSSSSGSLEGAWAMGKIG